MKQLLSIEWLKLKGYRTFYIFLGLYAVLVFAGYFGFDKLIKNGFVDLSVVYRFPNVWYYAGYISSWFSLIPAILMINLITNEIAFRTFRQHIIDGLSRHETLFSKIGLAAIIAIGAAMLVFFTGLIVGIFKGGSFPTPNNLLHLEYVLRSFWVSFGTMCAGIFLALLIKRAALAILALLIMYWVIEPLIGRLWFPELYPYFPLNSLDDFISSPIQFENIQFGLTTTSIGVTIAGLIWPLIFIYGSYLLLKKSDL